MAGMIGALALTLLIIGAYVGFRALNWDVPSAGVEAIDYLEPVGAIQQQGLEPVYPESLPADWIATRVRVEQGPGAEWGIDMLNPAGRYVGLRQEDASVESLLETYVDEEIEQLDPVDVGGTLSPEWTAYAGADDDRALVAEVDGDTVVLFGRTGTDDLSVIAERLTTVALE